MNSVDIVILVVVATNLILGAYRGAAWQILRLASIGLGIWVAWRFAEPCLAELPESWEISEDYGIYLVRIVLFLSVYLLMFGITNLVKAGIKKVKLGSWDRTLGAGIGAFKGALFASLILYLQLTPLGKIEAIEDLLHGNEEKNMPSSRANEIFLSYVKDRIDTTLSPQQKEKIVKVTDDLEDLIKKK